MRGTSRESSNWMSLSDMMTGLMIIFLFIAIAYMADQKRQTQKFKEYAVLQNELYQDLQSALEEIEEVKVKPDLSIVISNESSTFTFGKDDLSRAFKATLDTFYEAYLDVLLDDKYRAFISEVRIEGHTDKAPYKKGESKDPFISNVELSQDRARHVLEYLWSTDRIQKSSNDIIEILEYWFTANGLSYGRMVNFEGKLIHRLEKTEAKLIPNDDASRRVEFRIVTNAANLIDEYNKKNSND